MAEMIKIPAATTLTSGRSSPWAPLGEPLFRSLWIASVISYTGTWMQNVGAGWLMTQMTLNPLMVGLVQAAAALPVFLVILPAGALVAPGPALSCEGAAASSPANRHAVRGFHTSRKAAVAITFRLE